MRGYNAMGGYNLRRYNAEGTDLNLDDSGSLSETFVNAYRTNLFDFLVVDPTLSIQVTEKLLIDSILLSDWLIVRRVVSELEWQDQNPDPATWTNPDPDTSNPWFD